MHGVIACERPDALSQRETEVLRLLAHGSANKQIARDLGIAEKTVKTHVSSILGKLGCGVVRKRHSTPDGWDWSR